MITHKAKNGNGTLIRRGGVYYAAWMFNGKKYRVSTGETTEREARKRLAEIVANFTKGREAEAVLESVKESLQRAARHNLRIADAWAEYEQNKLRRAVAESTLRVYRLRFGVFARWAAGKVEFVDDVSVAVARRFMAHVAETASGKTFNDFLAVLSLTWKTFMADGRAAENPWTEIERKTKDTCHKDEFTAEQLNAIFNATSGDPEMRLLFYTGLYTGARLKDCCLLKWDAVDLAGGFIRITPEKTKRHGIAVSIPILPPLAEALRAARNADEGAGVYVLPKLAELYQQSGGKYVNNRLKTVFKRAGIEVASSMEGRSRKVTNYGFHSTRHFFVSMAARAGIRQEIVRAIVGHNAATTTFNYTHVREADLKAAMAAFPAIAIAGAERPAPRAEAVAVAEIPAEAGTRAERPLDALARLLAEMDAGELEEAARMLVSETTKRRA